MEEERTQEEIQNMENGECLMQFSTCSVQGVVGVCCRMIFLHGKQFTPNLSDGKEKGP